MRTPWVWRVDVWEQSVYEWGRQVAKQIVSQRCNRIRRRAPLFLYRCEHKTYQRSDDGGSEKEDAPQQKIDRVLVAEEGNGQASDASKEAKQAGKGICFGRVITTNTVEHDPAKYHASDGCRQTRKGIVVVDFFWVDL